MYLAVEEGKTPPGTKRTKARSNSVEVEGSEATLPLLKTTTKRAKHGPTFSDGGDAAPISLKGSASKTRGSPMGTIIEHEVPPLKISSSKQRNAGNDSGPLAMPKHVLLNKSRSENSSPSPLRLNPPKGRNFGDRKMEGIPPTVFGIVAKNSSDEEEQDPPLEWSKTEALVYWENDSWGGNFVFERTDKTESPTGADTDQKEPPSDLKGSWRGRLRRPKSAELSASINGDDGPNVSPRTLKKSRKRTPRQKSSEGLEGECSPRRGSEISPKHKQGILFNFRDLAFATEVAGEGVNEGRIFRTACLSRGYVTEKDVRASLHYISNVIGIQTIIDLRTREEKQEDRFDDFVEMVYPTLGYQPTERTRKRYNVCFVNKDFKMKGVFWHASTKSTKMKMVSSVFNRDKRVKCAGEGALNPLGLAGINKLMILYAYEEIVTAFRLISNPDNHPILIHCASGKDRTGLICALILACCGVDEEDIVENYHASEKYLDSVMPLIVDENRVKGLSRLFDGTPKNVMVDTLDFIKEKWGSVHDYLDDIGFSYEEQKQLVTLLTKEPERVMIEVSNKVRGEVCSALKKIEKNDELRKTKDHNQRMKKMMEEAQQEFRIVELEKALSLAQAKNERCVQIIASQSIEIEELRRTLALYEKEGRKVDTGSSGAPASGGVEGLLPPTKDAFGRRGTLDFFSMMAEGYFATANPAGGGDKRKKKKKKKRRPLGTSQHAASPEDNNGYNINISNNSHNNSSKEATDTETTSSASSATDLDEGALEGLAFHALHDVLSQSSNVDFYEMLRKGYKRAFGDGLVTSFDVPEEHEEDEEDVHERKKSLQKEDSKDEGMKAEEKEGKVYPTDEEFRKEVLEETQKEVLAEKIRLRAERYGTMKLFSLMGGGFNTMLENEAGGPTGMGSPPARPRRHRAGDSLLASATGRHALPTDLSPPPNTVPDAGGGVREGEKGRGGEGAQCEFPVLYRSVPDPRKRLDW